MWRPGNISEGTMKPCVECHHYYEMIYDYCMRMMIYNWMTGEWEPMYLRADQERGMIFPFDVILGLCGRRGRFFRPKEE